jgi:hypothetical protein
MQKELTIRLDEKVYDGLRDAVGDEGASAFIENLIRPFVVLQDLENAYEQQSLDVARESEAEEWSEAMIQDVSDEPR